MKLQVGVKLLIKNGTGQYLFIQRSEALTGGPDWDIPGGRINPSERLRDALTRELKEEVGIDLDSKIKLLEAQDIIRPEIDLHVVRLTYTAEFEKDIKLGTEHKDFTWITQQEALDLNLDPYLREVLEAL